MPEVTFIGQLSGDGECSFIKTEREETLKLKPFLNEWYDHALKEMEDFSDEEREEELKFIRMDETRVSLDDIFNYFQCQNKTKYKITVIMEEV